MSKISYQVHCSNLGWLNPVEQGAIAGTVGQRINVEAYRITGLDIPNLGVHAFAHVQNVGWSSGNIMGEDVGSTGQKRHIECIKIGLIGSEADNYDLWYRVHSANLGWLNWTRNGGEAGTVGGNTPIEAIQMELHAKSEGFDPRVNHLENVINLTPQNPPVANAPNIIDVARSYLGYVSGSEEDSAFGRRLIGAMAGPWCCYFVSCCALDAGLNVPITGSCPDMMDWAIKYGRWTGTPQPGFFVLYDWDGNGNPNHIGIVEQVINAGHVIAIEGNTGSPIGVYRRDRAGDILGYINPF